MTEPATDFDVAAADAVVAAAPEDVRELFWDIRAWHAIWSKIDDVEVLYDDDVHQEFLMHVQRDGRQEEVRTIRYRREDGDIEFFSPLPPPTMTEHRGYWGFRAEPSGSRCRVTARREYQLARDGDEPDGRRRRRYAERLSQRLQAILDCFVAHFDGMTCTQAIDIDGSPEHIGAFLADVHNLPRWTGFFRSVGRAAGDRWEVETALGTTILTRIDRGAGGRYTISSLIGDREERAELTLAGNGSRTRVTFTVRLRPALVERLGGNEHALATQSTRMRDELHRLRAAVTTPGA